MGYPTHEENQKLAQRINLSNLEESSYFPKFFEIETVNACNARCTMCTINDWDKGQNVVMSDGLFAKFVEEVSGYVEWVETVCLNRDGEPTLDKKLSDRVKMLKDAGVRNVTFATNGQLLRARLVNRLIDAGLDDIMVSIDGITKETFEAIRVRLNYETVLQNTLDLIRIRNERQSGLTIRVRMVILESNKHELAEWMTFWNSQISPQDRVYAKPAHTWGNQLGLESNHFTTMLAGVPCVSPFSTVIIDVDGRVPLCGADYNVKHSMGDFSQQSIKEIWASEPFAEVRNKHANENRNQIVMCRGCHIWERDLMVTENLSSGSIDPVDATLTG